MLTYTLQNGEQLAAKNPETFEIPPEKVRYSLSPGDHAKVIFDIPGYMPERMWVQIENVRRQEEVIVYSGALDNEPARILLSRSHPAPYDLEYGEPVEFGPEHVIDVSFGE